VARRSRPPPWVGPPIARVEAGEATRTFGRLWLGRPRRVHVVAADSGHDVPTRQPELVVAAVRWPVRQGHPHPGAEPARTAAAGPTPPGHRARLSAPGGDQPANRRSGCVGHSATSRDGERVNANA
jgi:hypothetical protein